jgi:hypothetical protein
VKHIGIAFCAAVVLLAGCGGGGPKGNGEAAKTPAQIVADAKAAALGAKSVHIAGSIRSGGRPLTVDVHIAAGKGGEGRLSVNGLTFDIRRIGDTAYFKASAAVWRHFGGAVAALLLKGRWLKASATTGQFASFTQLTDLGKLFNAAAASTKGKLAIGKTTTLDGQPVVEVDDPAKGASLYIAATGPPYPLALAKKGSGRITFDDWNAPVALQTPSPTLDFAKLTGG